MMELCSGGELFDRIVSRGRYRWPPARRESGMQACRCPLHPCAELHREQTITKHIPCVSLIFCEACLRPRTTVSHETRRKPWAQEDEVAKKGLRCLPVPVAAMRSRVLTELLVAYAARKMRRSCAAPSSRSSGTAIRWASCTGASVPLRNGMVSSGGRDHIRGCMRHYVRDLS